MTTPSARSVDLEALARHAVSSVAVAAHARGVELAVHIDHRLPAGAHGDGAAVGAYLRRALARTIAANRTGRVALSFWLAPGDDGPGSDELGSASAGGGACIELEVRRAPAEGGGPFPTRLAELWALPLGPGFAPVLPHGQDTAAEAVMIRLPLAPDRNAPPLAEKRRPAFQGRYFLHVRDLLLDTGRFRESLAALGLEMDVTTSPDQALALARARAAAGKSVDMVLMDAVLLGPAAVDLARALRADPRLASALLVLVDAGKLGGLSPDEARLFDTAPRAQMPWQPLLDVMQEQLETRSASAGQPAGFAEPGTTAPGPTAPGTARPGTAEIPRLAGRRILIAEDVDTNQVLLRAMLEPTGAGIETVPDGDVVLARHAEDPADLILMDLQMPGMGGIAAARRIRALEGAAGAVPIIALTAYARAADRDRAMQAGMDAYISKPVVIAEFYRLVRCLLKVAATPR